MEKSYVLRGVRQGLSFFSPCDQIIVADQMRDHALDMSLILGVAARCPWGAPQVLTCKPLNHGRPFPTTYWLTCPYLTYLCGCYESSGGVHQLEDYLRAAPAAYRRYNTAYALRRISLLSEAERRFLRAYRPKIWEILRSTGVGGIRQRGHLAVKCLHLQTAAALALPGSPAEPWLVKRLKKCHCDDARCIKDTIIQRKS